MTRFAPVLLRSALLVTFAWLGPGILAQAQVEVAAERVRPSAEVQRVLALGGSDNRVQDHLDYLVNRIGSRLTSSSNLQRACEWAAAQFASWGLDARLERWGEVAVGFDRRGMSGGMVYPESVPFDFTTPSWTPGTPGPVRGEALLEPRDEAELETMRARRAGAWIVRRTRGERPAREVRDTLENALLQGKIAGEIRTAGNSRGLVLTSGNPRIRWDDLPKLVTVRLRDDQYQDLVARLRTREQVVLSFDIDNRFLPGPVPQYNVVADIPGVKHPDEYVIVGGHIDSWDGAPGACDNGTGVATTLEAARLLMASGARPDRTIRFMLWGGEEQGLLGSRAYVRDHPELMEKISAVLVHDGGTNYLSGIAATPAMAEDLRDVTAPLTGLNPEMPFEVHEVDGLANSGSSDHAPFLDAGVPGFFWRQSGTSDYQFVHHTQHDHFEYAIPHYQEHSAMVVAVTALGIANLDGLLDRTGLIRERERRDDGRRRMGVFLEDTTVIGLVEGGMAEKAGWQDDDVILAIDGVAVNSRDEIVVELQKGEPKKTFRLQRGSETIESVLDFTNTPGEEARARRTRRQAETDEGAPEPPAAQEEEPEPQTSGKPG